MADDRRADTWGCPRCWPADAETAWRAQRELTLVARPVDESHYDVALVACPDCGQHFVSVFTETIDWVDGDDPQYTTVLPLTPAEAAELRGLTGGALETRLQEAGPDRRSLRRDYPKGADGASTFWATGLVIGWHD